MSSYTQLLYVSSAPLGTTLDTVLSIHKSARDRNAKADVTGLLLYGSGNFLQLLEGHPDTVPHLFARISADRRHSDVRVLLQQTTDRRIFPNWSMGLLVVDERSPIDLARFRQIIDAARQPGAATPSRNMRILECIKEFRAQLKKAA